MTGAMTGAEALIGTLTGTGVDVCFTNPGTSEMHFVQAMDRVPAMRGVLAVFEGVATGAADGYARITGRPAAVLLHLGPGLANGLANLHNARRAGSPLLCLVLVPALVLLVIDTVLFTTGVYASGSFSTFLPAVMLALGYDAMLILFSYWLVKLERSVT